MARTPVLFIPGLCGSFNLLVLLDFQGPRLSGWSFPPFISYGRRLLETFIQAGYVRNTDLFVAFYDWRKSVHDAARLYLKPWIERAKRRARADKVILIGHSMGGLVARSYIQGPDYANDVERLITIGTPHRGAAEAYYAWGGGVIRSDPVVKAVFDVYLWYLRHVHPFQTELDPLRTIRTQVPSIRDLLPIDDYLLGERNGGALKSESLHVERNLTGVLLNHPTQMELLVGRVPVTTITGTGFPTIQAIVVGDPPNPPGDPPRFPDGAPIRDEVDVAGDGTVRLVSSQLSHPGVNNRDPLTGAAHGGLPDHPAVLSQVFEDLGVEPIALGAPSVEETRLVVLTASPVTMVVETPAGAPITPPSVLGVSAEIAGVSVRSRRVHARDYGHGGKHLNMAVISNPPAGVYRVHLHGTQTGPLALGALIVSADQMRIMGSGENGGVTPVMTTAHTAISTAYGRVTEGADLFYEVVVTDVATPPDVHLDIQATAADALAKLRAASGGVVLGAAPTVEAPAEALPTVREAVAGDEAVTATMMQLLGGAETAALADALSRIARDVVGPHDPALAEALVTQFQALKLNA